MTLSDLERRASVERLFERHYAAVLAYALRRAPRAMAEDVASETFVVVSRRLDDVPADALPWLYGVARRALANERRGQLRRDRLTHELALNASAAYMEPPRGEVGRMVAALAQLAEPDREALLLIAWEGLSSADAAVAAGCSRVAMRARLSRARRRLARILEGEEQTSGTSPATPAGGPKCSVVERSS